MPVFLYRLRFPFPNFLLGEYTVIIEIIIATFMSLRYISSLKKNEKLILLFVNIILALHTIIALIVIDYDIQFQYIFKTIRYVYYVSLTYLYARLFFDQKIFFKIFINFTILSLLPFIMFVLNDNFFSLKDYHANRFAGLFSEPSALSPFLTVLIILSIFKKKYFYILPLGYMFFKTDSGTSFIVLILTLMLILFKFNKKTFFKLSITFTVLGLISYSYISTNIDLSLLTSFQKIETVLYKSNFDNGEFGQARIQTLYNSFMIMFKDNAFVLGYGTNTWEAITNKEKEFRIFNFIHFIFISFGVFAFVLAYFIIRNVIEKFRKLSFEGVCVMLAFLFASLLNSAQGVIIWKIFFLYLFIPLKNYTSNSKLSI